MNIKRVLAGICVCIVITSLCSQAVCAIEIQTTCCVKSGIEAPQDALRYKKLITQFQQKRSLVYNALNLSDEQVLAREELFNNHAPLYEEKFNELIKESYTLKALSLANAGKCEINNQKKVVKNIKEDIDKLIKEEDKNFKKCMTREQRSKYAMIRKLERNDYKAASHQKDYYKSNPKMRPFGNPKPSENNKRF